MLFQGLGHGSRPARNTARGNQLGSHAFRSRGKMNSAPSGAASHASRNACCTSGKTGHTRTPPPLCRAFLGLCIVIVQAAQFTSTHRAGRISLGTRSPMNLPMMTSSRCSPVGHSGDTRSITSRATNTCRSGFGRSEPANFARGFRSMMPYSTALFRNCLACRARNRAELSASARSARSQAAHTSASAGDISCSPLSAPKYCTSAALESRQVASVDLATSPPAVRCRMYSSMNAARVARGRCSISPAFASRSRIALLSRATHAAVGPSRGVFNAWACNSRSTIPFAVSASFLAHRPVRTVLRFLLWLNRIRQPAFPSLDRLAMLSALSWKVPRAGCYAHIASWQENPARGVYRSELVWCEHSTSIIRLWPPEVNRAPYAVFFPSNAPRRFAAASASRLDRASPSPSHRSQCRPPRASHHTARPPHRPHGSPGSGRLSNSQSLGFISHFPFRCHNTETETPVFAVFLGVSVFRVSLP